MDIITEILYLEERDVFMSGEKAPHGLFIGFSKTSYFI